MKQLAQHIVETFVIKANIIELKYPKQDNQKVRALFAKNKINYSENDYYFIFRDKSDLEKATNLCHQNDIALVSL